MLFIKSIKRIGILILVLSTIVTTSCTVYKTIDIPKPITEGNIKSAHLFKEVVVVHNNNLEDEYIVLDCSINNDTIKGELFPPQGKRHNPSDRNFSERKVQAFLPLKVLHVFTQKESLSKGKFELPINQVKHVSFHEKNIGASVSRSILLGLGIGIGGLAVVLPIICNCPQVETYHEGEPLLEGSLFPGALFKSLERKDYLVLDNLKLDNTGQLDVRVSNVLPETQYINQLEILQVEHKGYSNLGLSQENQLVAYNETIAPSVVYEEDNSLSEGISADLELKDGKGYDFDNTGSYDKLNTISIQFERSKLEDNPVLIIEGKQTAWLDTVANFIFYKSGKAQNNWTKRKDNSSPEKWKNGNIKRGLSLNVYQKKNDNWEYIGTHHDVGTSSMRSIVMELDLMSSTEPMVEIKLESAYKVWEIDYVGIANDWNSDLDIQKIPLQSAENQKGENVFSTIDQSDKQYLVLEEKDTYVHLKASTSTVPSDATIVLSGTGYYHKTNKTDKMPDVKFALQFKDKLGFQDISRALDMQMKLYPGK